MKIKNIVLVTSIIMTSILILTGCSSKSSGSSKATLDFQEISVIEFNGLNGNGSISIDIDDSVYEDDKILDKLYPDDTTLKAKTKFIELLADVNYIVSKENDLSNGDKVTVTVDYYEDKFKERGIKVKNSEFTVTVDGLENGTKIDVFDGLKVSYSGLSGKGFAIFDTNDCDTFTQDYVYFEYPESELSNGDTITVTARYDFDVAEENLVIIENDTKEYTVSGLKEPKKIDPFEKLEITYTGASPYINAVVDSTKCDSVVNQYIQFNVEDKYLRNGDTFTVTAVYNEYDANEYGFIVKTDTHTYTVENQPEYVTSLEELDLTALQSELNDKLTVITSANKGDFYFSDVYVGNFQSISSSALKSSYLVSLKTSFEDKFDRRNYNYNRYIKIYEYIINTKNDGDKKVYVAVYVNNIQKNADGSISWDIELGAKGDENYDTLVNTFATSEKEFYNVSEIPIE